MVDDPTALWESLCKTDPDATKEFQRPGGFKGTAIDPMWRIYKLTEQVGPCGIGWGFDIVKESYEEGIHTVRIRFWYILGGQKGEFDVCGSTPVLMKRRDGAMADEEYAKKSLTDAICTAMKMLGMSADVYMGKFDGDKYGSPQPPAGSAPRPSAPAAQGPPPDGPQGAGGDAQDCPSCGNQGVTRRFWNPGERSPDLECASGCAEEYKGKSRPKSWWSITRGGAAKSKAAINAQAPLDPDDDIPF